MTDKITNIKELYELINPELLTTEQSCLEMITKVQLNENILKNYVEKVIKKLAKIKNEKVFTQESRYEVCCLDYYVASKSENIESCLDSLYSLVIDYRDGFNFQDYEELKE